MEGLGGGGGLKTDKGRDISKKFPQCRKKTKPNGNCIYRLIVCVTTQMSKPTILRITRGELAPRACALRLDSLNSAHETCTVLTCEYMKQLAADHIAAQPPIVGDNLLVLLNQAQQIRVLRAEVCVLFLCTKTNTRVRLNCCKTP